MGLIDPSGIRDTWLAYGFAPRIISASPNSCMIQAPSLRGSRNHSNDRLGHSTVVLRQDRPRSAVPQTMLSPSAVPHTMLSPSPPVPQTMLSPSLPVPHTMLSPSPAVPHTMLSPQSELPHDVPQTMLSPSSPSVLTAPQTIFLSHAFAPGTMMPPVMRWFPQKNCLLQIGSTGTRAPLRAVL